MPTSLPGLLARPPARPEPGPGRLLPPRLFRRLIERSSPVVEPVDQRTSLKVPPRSVLVLRTDEVGDLAMTLPLLTALRAAWPQARVTLVMRGSRGDLLRGGSLVDEVVSWTGARPWPGSLLGQLRCWRFARRLLRRARPLRGRFDLAVLPRRDEEHFGARYVACAAAARVVGFDPGSEVGERDLITDRVGPGDPRTHMLRHSERMATAMGVTITPDAYDAPGLALISPADHENARTLLSPLTGTSGPLIAVTLGTSGAYAAAINEVFSRLPIRVVLIGPASDQAAADEFIQALTPTIPLVSTIGRAHARATLALLVGSDLYLGGFGDTMHLASSVATPCITVNSWEAGAEAPWSAGSRVVAPRDVARAVAEVLIGAPEPAREAPHRRLDTFAP